MILSEFIEILQNYKLENGNIEVRVAGEFEGSPDVFIDKKIKTIEADEPVLIITVNG